MKSAARKKVSIPTLEERVKALMEELDDALNALAAERKALVEKNGPEGGALPQATLRLLMDTRGWGDCLCRTHLVAKGK